jgi:hypothetical protein
VGKNIYIILTRTIPTAIHTRIFISTSSEMIAIEGKGKRFSIGIFAW